MREQRRELRTHRVGRPLARALPSRRNTYTATPRRTRDASGARRQRRNAEDRRRCRSSPAASRRPSAPAGCRRAAPPDDCATARHADRAVLLRADGADCASRAAGPAAAAHRAPDCATEYSQITDATARPPVPADGGRRWLGAPDARTRTGRAADQRRRAARPERHRASATEPLQYQRTTASPPRDGEPRRLPATRSITGRSGRRRRARHRDPARPAACRTSARPTELRRVSAEAANAPAGSTSP